MNPHKLNEQIRFNLKNARKIKKRHKDSNQCDRHKPGGCTACHFWSGTISALGELAGEHGIID